MHADPAPGQNLEDARRLRAVFDGVEHFLGLLTPDGIVLDANEASLRRIGVSRDAVVGQLFARAPWFASPEQQARVADAVREAAGGRTVYLEMSHASADGCRVDIELTLTPVPDGDRVAYIVPEGRDVTERNRAERARLASDQQLAGILDIAADAIITIDASQRIRLFNQGAERAFGYRAEEVLGERIEMLLPESARDGHAAHVAGFGGGTQQSRFMNQRRPVVGRRSDGELFPAEATISRLDTGDEPLFTAVMRDISERRRAERELARARQYTEAILSSVPEGVVGLDRDGRVTFVNPAACDLLGYAQQELVGQALHAMVHHSHADGRPYPFDDCPVRAAIHDGVASRSDADVYWRADGSMLPVQCAITPFMLEGATAGAVVVFRDDSARREAEQRLRSLSHVDELTGLLNRRGFTAQATQALQQARRSGSRCRLLFIDLDYLKTINDRHGHAAGDRALRDVAGILRDVFRDSDVLARVGGDEFVVLAPGCAGADDTVRRRLGAALDARNRATDAGFPLSVSIGEAAFDPAAPKALEQLVAAADAALYREKHARRG